MNGSQGLVGVTIGERYRLTYALPEEPLTIAAYAHDSETASTVFVKAKVAAAPESNPETAVRLEREASLLANLNHPQIPTLLDVNVENQALPYIVTEVMPGIRHLPRWLRAYSAPRLAAKICLSALDPLEYVHNRGITHRDVKTKNLVMQLAGQTSLVDFELGFCKDGATAEVMYSGSHYTDPSITEPKRVKATADYVAPERAMGEVATPLSDIYSMGIVLYELLYGKVPFNGMPWHVAHQHCHGQIDFTFPQNRNVPNGLVEIIKLATQKDPSDRYQSTGAMRADLSRYLNS